MDEGGVWMRDRVCRVCGCAGVVGRVCIIPLPLIHCPQMPGTCESRNAGTRNGTRNGSKMRAARYRHLHHTRTASLFTGLDWTHPKICFQCTTGAKHTYLFTKVACIACFCVFPRVGRGQRSRAYLMSFSKMLFNQSWMIEEYYFLFSMLQQKAGVRCLR